MLIFTELWLSNTNNKLHTTSTDADTWICIASPETLNEKLECARLHYRHKAFVSSSFWWQKLLERNEVSFILMCMFLKWGCSGWIHWNGNTNVYDPKTFPLNNLSKITVSWGLLSYSEAFSCKGCKVQWTSQTVFTVFIDTLFPTNAFSIYCDSTWVVRPFSRLEWHMQGLPNPSKTFSSFLF